MKKVKVTWEIDDGYAGGARPQHTNLDEDDFYGCEIEEDFMEVIEEAVQADYEQKGFYIKNIDWGEIKPPRKQN